MKKYSIVALFMLIMLSLFILPLKGIAAEEAEAGNLPLAPDFTLQGLKNESIALSSYKDKKSVILFFWTTWCPFCRAELKVLNGKYEQLMKDGFEVLAINIGESAHKVGTFIKKYNLPYAVLLDQDTAVANMYHLIGVPTYVVVDKKGYVRFIDNAFPAGLHKD